MSGATENNWEFHAEKYESMEGVAKHNNELFNKITNLPWWNDSIKLIDFGCGSGYLSRKLITEGKAAHITCVDVEEDMVNLSRRRVEENNLTDKITVELFKKIDGSELVSNSADCLCTVTVLGHVRELDIPIIYSNMARSLKSGGRLIIAEFHNVGQRTHGHGHSHGHSHSHEHHSHDDNSDSHGHSHSHSHEHHSHGGNGHSHGHGHSHGEHVSDGGHVHTNLNEEIFSKLAADNGLEVETVQFYTLDIEEWGPDGKDLPMIFFVAKKP